MSLKLSKSYYLSVIIIGARPTTTSSIQLQPFSSIKPKSAPITIVANQVDGYLFSTVMAIVLIVIVLPVIVVPH
jgi:hypothetical protein